MKNDSLSMSIGNFNQLKRDLKTGKGVNLRERYDKILSESINHFKDNTQYYDEKVAAENI